MSASQSQDMGVILRSEDLLTSGALSPRLETRSTAFREQLGLPAGCPIIMGGHQCEFWHAGILAKWFVVDAIAKHVDGLPAWLHVDIDANDAGSMRYPTSDLRANEWRWAPRADGVPTGLRPSATARSIVTPVDAHPCVVPGVELLSRALALHERAGTLGGQVAAALHETLVPLTSGRVRGVSAMNISGTDEFAVWVARMREDARTCIDAYNRAVRAHPSARLRELEPGELPLWWVEKDRPRRRVLEHELGVQGGGMLAPRALLMTALLRTHGCEVFVHGLGAELYERVTRDWISGWLGQDAAQRLAPTVIASATLKLPLGDAKTPTPEEIARAAWLARSARYAPALVDDEVSAREVRGLVGQVRAAGTPQDRARAFSALREAQRRSRMRNAIALRELDERAMRMHAQLHAARVVHERAWAWRFHADETICALREAVEHRVRALLRG